MSFFLLSGHSFKILFILLHGIFLIASSRREDERFYVHVNGRSKTIGFQSNELWWNRMGSNGFWWMNSDGWILMDEFWWMNSDGFWWVLISFDVLWWVMMSYDGFKWVLMGSDGVYKNRQSSNLHNSRWYWFVPLSVTVKVAFVLYL